MLNAGNMWKLIGILVVLSLSSCSSPTKVSTDLPDSSRWPRMPDEYRNKDQRKIDPVGMWAYDAAETQAEDDYFGVEVLSLEESQRILKERKEGKKSAPENTVKETE